MLLCNTDLEDSRFRRAEGLIVHCQAKHKHLVPRQNSTASVPYPNFRTLGTNQRRLYIVLAGQISRDTKKYTTSLSNRTVFMKYSGAPTADLPAFSDVFNSPIRQLHRFLSWESFGRRHCESFLPSRQVPALFETLLCRSLAC